MSVEILSVSLSDESLEKLAQRVAQLVGQPVSATLETRQESTPEPQDDPWAGGNAQSASQPASQTQSPQQPAQGQPATNTPTCAHGPMRYVPGGFSRSTNRPYPAFYGCPTPRGTPNQCKSVPA